MKASFLYTSIWQFLDDVEVLEHGSEEEIQKAKKSYWREYRKWYTRGYRQANREVMIRFEPKEYEQVLRYAKEAQLPVYRYIQIQLLQRTTHMQRDSTEVFLKLSRVQTIVENMARNSSSGWNLSLVLGGLAELEEEIRAYDN